ncbi:MAG: hypothetical protein U0Q18_27690 [Bryobacteraceae bacterium]
MALDPQTLHDSILAAFKSLKNETDPDKAQETLATKLSEAIDTYVKSGEVKGVTVALAGGLTASQMGSVKLT